MKHFVFHLDFISPYAYLAFERLPIVLEGISHAVSYRPVLLGALLRHHGQRGPAEIPGKREWTYRHVLWLAQHHGIPMQMPARHPFHPLGMLRAALATSADGDVSRYVAETVFHEVWRTGGDAADGERIERLRARLPRVHEAPLQDDEATKQRLRANTEAALAAGVFGTPTFEFEGRLFFGLDSLEMLRAALAGEPWFDGPDWQQAGERPGLSPGGTGG